jgi:hypothetical protein
MNSDDIRITRFIDLWKSTFGKESKYDIQHFYGEKWSTTNRLSIRWKDSYDYIVEVDLNYVHSLLQLVELVHRKFVNNVSCVCWKKKEDFSPYAADVANMSNILSNIQRVAVFDDTILEEQVHAFINSFQKEFGNAWTGGYNIYREDNERYGLCVVITPEQKNREEYFPFSLGIDKIISHISKWVEADIQQTIERAKRTLEIKESQVGLVGKIKDTMLKLGWLKSYEPKQEEDIV